MMLSHLPADSVNVICGMYLSIEDRTCTFLMERIDLEIII